MEAFQLDAYRPLANYMYFGGHQMSVLSWGYTVRPNERVSSNGHQMSLVGGSHVWNGTPCPISVGAVYSEVRSFIGNGHMGSPAPYREND